MVRFCALHRIKHTYVCTCIPPEAEPIGVLDQVTLQLILSASFGALAPDV